MDGFQTRLNAIGAAIVDTYIQPSAPPVIESPAQMMAVPQ
jgi:hypothetical protein